MDSVSSKRPAHLHRQIGLATAGLVLVANMIGAGIFANTGKIQADVGAPWLVIALWAVGGVMALSGALCYAELGAMMPHAGGEYVYLRTLFGRMWSFLSGWISFVVGFAAPAASTAILSGDYLHQLIQSVAPGSALAQIFAEPVYQRVYAASLIILFSGIHVLGVRSGSLVQNLLTVLKLFIIGLFLCGGFAVIALGGGSGQLGVAPEAASATGGMALPGWSALAIGLLWVGYAYSGWNSATYLAEEIEKPERNLPRAMIIGTVGTILLYVALNILYYLAAPAGEFSGSFLVASIAAERLFGANISVIFKVAFCLLMLSSMSAYIMIGPRVYFAMARDNLFFSYARRINPRFGTPVVSIFFQAALALVYIFTGTYDSIMTLMGFALMIFPLLTVIGLVIDRYRRPRAERPYRAPFFPLAPAIFIGLSVFTMVGSYLEAPASCLWALLIAAGGVPVYFVWTSIYRWLAGRQTAIVPD
ncbi:MAG: amino acid permease [Leptospirales bacterium]|nr:amino acid permease [Leptospirales bacterium]